MIGATPTRYRIVITAKVRDGDPFELPYDIMALSELEAIAGAVQWIVRIAGKKEAERNIIGYRVEVLP